MSNSIINAHSEHKTHALVSYILIGFGLFTAIPILFGAVWAMIKKNDAYGTVYHSHLVNATRTFWWSLFWGIIGGLLSLIYIGFAILGISWLWALYRIINGGVKILADQPYPL